MPTVSKVNDSGTTPLRLAKPNVGRNPTRPATLAGPRIEPEVSVPKAKAAKSAATAAAEPLLEPETSREVSYGFKVTPPGNPNDAQGIAIADIARGGAERESPMGPLEGSIVEINETNRQPGPTLRSSAR